MESGGSIVHIRRIISAPGDTFWSQNCAIMKYHRVDDPHNGSARIRSWPTIVHSPIETRSWEEWWPPIGRTLTPRTQNSSTTSRGRMTSSYPQSHHACSLTTCLGQRPELVTELVAIHSLFVRAAGGGAPAVLRNATTTSSGACRRFFGTSIKDMASEAQLSNMEGRNGAAKPLRRTKLRGRAFYESIGSPKLVLAPMVEQSEFVRHPNSLP